MAENWIPGESSEGRLIMPTVQSQIIPLIAMRELVMFPRNQAPFIVGRPQSLAALEASRGEIALFTQLDGAVENPEPSELSTVGVVASITNVQAVASGKRVLAEATRRVRIAAVRRRKTYTSVKVSDVAELSGRTEPKDLAELRRLYLQLSPPVEIHGPGRLVTFEDAPYYFLSREHVWILGNNPYVPLSRSEMPVFLASEDAGVLADAVAHRLPLKQGQKLSLLEEIDKAVRLLMLKRILEQEIDNRALERDLNERVRQATKAQHREIFMREQLKQVLQELGEGAPLALHNPVFKGRGFRLDQRLAFVLMPFNATFRPIYDEIIRPALESQGMRSVRADDIYGPKAIIEDIWRLINEATLIVADFSGKNPNVFYEVGLAHAIGKDVVLLSQSMDDVPFDLRHLRCILYSDSVAGFRALEKGLKETLSTLQIPPQASSS